MNIAALIVAAGRGSRAAGIGDLPKQYAGVAGTSILARSITAFARHPAVAVIQAVIHPDDAGLYVRATAPFGDALRPAAPGGATRQASVLAGLEALAALGPDVVLIHDAARPFVTATVIDRVIAGLAGHAGAVPALPVVDTLKRAGAGGLVTETAARDGLYRVQTPQGFRFAPILAAHRAAAGSGRTGLTDDAAIAESAGLDVVLVAGSEDNFKVTTADDVQRAERMIIAAGNTLDIRIGNGFDVHRFTAGDHVWLCGVCIPHTSGLEGHSDADVALHALTDAILGALGDGDIGQHFPPSDPQWKGAPSHVFLADAARRAAERGGRIANVDVTILCEAPKISPHRDAMRARVAEILRVELARVGVKATTTEGLGFTGRREGIAAIATATLGFPIG